MTENTVEGIVEAVSVRTGGILISGKWYNPSSGLVPQDIAKVRGGNVVLTLNGPTSYSAFFIRGQNPPQDRRELLIVRQSCLKSAVEIAQFLEHPEKSIAESVLAVAEKFEDWVLR